MRKSVYWSSLFVALASLALSIFSSRSPRWIEFTTPASSPLRFASQYGLWVKCDGQSRINAQLTRAATPFDLDQGDDNHIHWHCRAFPLRRQDCEADGRRMQSMDVSGDESESFGFCDGWRTAAYSNSVGIALGIAAILTIFLTLSPMGSRKRREQAWKLASGLQGSKALLSLVSIILIARLYDQDDRFWAGSKLGVAFVLSCVALGIDCCLVAVLAVGGLTGVAATSKRRGYSEIPSDAE